MGRWSGLAMVLLSAALGCGGGSPSGEGGARATAATATATPAATPAATPTPTPTVDEPWRFRSTLDQHLPAGAVAEPLMELSLPRQQRVIVLAAVLRAGAPEVGVERWTFEQIPGEEGLTLVEGGERLVRLSPGPRHQQLGDLRRSLAQPRAVLTRPVGLGDEPEATLEALRAALLAMRDPAGDPRARVQAVATAVRGLDDAVLLERDAAWELVALLDPGPQAVQVQRQSERRARATLTVEGGVATLELLRKADGWAVAAIEAPPPPEPATDVDTAGSTGAIEPAEPTQPTVEL